MKTCKICNTQKEFTEFTFRKDRGTYDSYCKVCRSEYYKKKDYDRKQYFENYSRIVTPERKLYLQEYLKPRRYKYRAKDKENRALYDVLKRVLRYTSVKRVNSKDAILGWSKAEFTERVGVITEGYHVDHKIPISWFLKDTPVSIINALDNLHLLPGEINTAKRNRYCHRVSRDFLQKVRPFIKPRYLQKLEENVELLILCV